MSLDGVGSTPDLSSLMGSGGTADSTGGAGAADDSGALQQLTQDYGDANAEYAQTSSQNAGDENGLRGANDALTQYEEQKVNATALELKYRKANFAERTRLLQQKLELAADAKAMFKEFNVAQMDSDIKKNELGAIIAIAKLGSWYMIGSPEGGGGLEFNPSLFNIIGQRPEDPDEEMAAVESEERQIAIMEQQLAEAADNQYYPERVAEAEARFAASSDALAQADDNRNALLEELNAARHNSTNPTNFA